MMDENEPTDEEIEKLAKEELESLLYEYEKEKPKKAAPEIYCGIWSVN